VIPFELSAQYRLKSGSLQYHLQKKVVKTKENPEGWKSDAYFCTLKEAVKGYRERLTRRGRGTLPQNLTNAANALDGASDRLTGLLEKWEEAT
jgi:hypothetical protein